MIASLKKLTYNLLCNRITGNLISILFPLVPDIRWKGYKFHVNRNKVTKKIVSSIFFGFYESSEIRMIHKFYEGQSDVIELGASLGVVSAHISSKMNAERKLVVVEANPYLKETIQKNINRFRKENYQILNVAVAYGVEEIPFAISSNNTESRIGTNGNSQTVSIKAMTLAEIIKRENISSYTLICDIEGAEIQFLLQDMEALHECRQIIIELHETSYLGNDYSLESLKNLITKQGFGIVSHEGPVYCFTRNST